MAQPTPYVRQADFSEDELGSVGGRSTVRTTALDAELDALGLTANETRVNLGLIQRDDDKLRDFVVETHTLGTDVRTLFAIGGTNPRGNWQTATFYQVRDVVIQGGATHICRLAHTSGTFTADLNAQRWLSINSINGPRGLTGATGATGPRGPAGVKGDPGNYIGLNLIGTGTTLAERPGSATEGQAWGLLVGGTIRIYIWSSGAWYDAGTITAPSAFSVANVIYVQEFGSDLNSGTSPGTAVRTIEKALEIAADRGEMTLIDWAPENPVLTRGNLDLPDNCAIVARHRTVFIRPEPGYESVNVFRMGSGCYIEGVMVEGFEVDDLDNPSTGFAFSFRPGAVITRVPYVHKCAVRRIPDWSLVPPPLDRVNGNPSVGNGPGVVLADGLVCSQYSIFPNIMTWGATPIANNGIGYCAKNGGLINAVNAVSMWAHKHFLALSGGQIILSACSTQFGDYTMWAEGSRQIVAPTETLVALAVDTTAADAIGAATTTLIEDMWAALVSGGYTAGWTATDEAYTRGDAALLLRALRWTLETANEQPMLDFAKGLFDTVGDRVYASGKQAAFVFSFEKLRDDINALAGVTGGTDAIVTGLFTALIATITAPVFRVEPSKITAIGHTWTGVLAGVALAKIPPAQNRGRIKDSIRRVNGGAVVASGQDDFGNALFVGGLEINARTGELGGPPFERAVRRVASKIAIARSF